MPSIKDGDYRVVGSVRSGSDINRWYPIAHDLNTPTHPSGAPKLSCHCPAWTKNVAGQAERTCKHTQPFAALIAKQKPAGFRTARPVITDQADITEILGYNPALQHLTGTWTMQEFEAPIMATRAGRPEPEPYHWWMLSLQTADLIRASGVVAVPANGVPADRRIVKQTLAAWAGYQIAADFLIRAGQRPGEPPTHFRDDARGARAKKIARELAPGAVAAPRQDGLPKYGIGDLMIAMNDPDQGDGKKPAQRAEELLKIMLGASYAAVDPQARPYQGYLDVPSAHPQADVQFLNELYRDAGRGHNLRIPQTCRELVYRVRIDAGREYDRRVRVWIDGSYTLDICMVREGYYNSKVPVADGFLSRYLGFMANPRSILHVIGGHNLFGPYSDRYYGEDRAGDTPPAPLHMRRA